MSIEAKRADAVADLAAKEAEYSIDARDRSSEV